MNANESNESLVNMDNPINKVEDFCTLVNWNDVPMYMPININDLTLTTYMENYDCTGEVDSSIEITMEVLNIRTLAEFKSYCNLAFEYDNTYGFVFNNEPRFDIGTMATNSDGSPVTIYDLLEEINAYEPPFTGFNELGEPIDEPEAS